VKIENVEAVLRITKTAVQLGLFPEQILGFGEKRAGKVGC
jgi:hypothetical protein